MKTKKSKEINIIIGQSLLRVATATGIGSIKAVKPNTNEILAMLEPTTFPMAISGEPCKAAFKLTINSGAEVPKETMVIPITNGESLNFAAIPTAPLTNTSPPPIKTANPPINNKYSIRFNF